MAAGADTNTGVTTAKATGSAMASTTAARLSVMTSTIAASITNTAASARASPVDDAALRGSTTLVNAFAIEGDAGTVDCQNGAMN